MEQETKQKPAQGAGNPEPSRADAGSFGKVAVKLGYISEKQLEEAIRAQQEANRAGNRVRLGEILIEKGYLRKEQLEKVQAGQANRKRIGDFELISKLGEGGMGSVFKARQVMIDRIVALKILSPKMAKDKSFRERFLREARAVAKFNHPHIVSGIDVGSADGYWYFAMEYVDGESLGQFMHRMGGKLPEKVALEFVRQVALALEHAHHSNVLHRDVKPDNILLDSSHRIAKLADLGLARTVESRADDAALTQAGQAVGTPFYISPEQARGSADLTPAADIYSLGATLFHSLTGTYLFDGPTAAVVMTRHLTDPAPSPRTLNPSISPETEKMVLRCLEKKPEDRYESAQELAEDIELILSDEPVSNRPEKTVAKPRRTSAEAPSGPSKASVPAVRMRKRRQRSNVMSMGMLAVVGCVILMLLLVLLQNQEPPAPPPDPPRRPPNTAVNPPPRDPVRVDPPARAIPVELRTDADGARAFRPDFDKKLENFDVDPAFARAGEFVTMATDATGKNHILKLAKIRHREFGYMARLLLPANEKFSPRATIAFRVCFGSPGNVPREVKVMWDCGREGEPRSVHAWMFKNPEFRFGWQPVSVKLGAAPLRLPTTEPADSPQYISIFAGSPDENVAVYIGDLEVVDRPKAADKAAPTPVTPPAEQPADTPAEPKKPQPEKKDANAIDKAL